MFRRHYPDTIGVMQCTTLGNCQCEILDNYGIIFSHRSRRYKSFSTSTPSGGQETESMAGTQSDAAKKSPFFALDPIIVPNIVGIREERIKTKEWNGVYIRVPRQ